MYLCIYILNIFYFRHTQMILRDSLNIAFELKILIIIQVKLMWSTWPFCKIP
jgi:hypothetical protein